MLTYRTDTILGDIPEDWEAKRLRDVLSFHTAGDWGADAGQTEVRAIRSTNFTESGRLDFSDVATRCLDSETASLLEPQKGDLLLERSGGGPEQPVGRIGFVREDLPGHAFSNFIHLLRPDPSKIEPDYLGWVLHRIQSTGMIVRLEQQTTGMRNLHFRDYLTVRFPKPPEAEQRAIADILDAADTAIESARTAIEKGQRLKLGLLQRLLTHGTRQGKLKPTSIGKVASRWQCERLSVYIQEGPTNGVYRPESDYGYDGAPIVRIDSFADGHIHDVASLRRVRLPPDEVTRYALREQDILINRVNSLSHIGKSAIVPVLLEPTVFESNMMRLRLKPDLLPEFLILFLCYDRARAYWLTRAKPAVNQSSINQKDVRQLHVPVPSPDEQREIVETAGANARLLETLVMRYQVLERLKRGLTQDLLTGKRRVVGDSLGTMKRQTLLRL